MSYIIARILWLFDPRLSGEPYAAGNGDGGRGLGWREDEFRTMDRFISSQDGPVVRLTYREELR